MTTIKGEKIILRPFRTEDMQPLWNSIGNENTNRLTGTHATFTREMIDAYVQRQIANDDASRISFIIAAPDDARALGEVVINDIDANNHSANIRIALFDDADMGKGFGTEAMRLMVDYGFRECHLHRISLEVYAFNPRAIRAYEKVGFVREGVLRDALYWDGVYVDAIMMSILAEEWNGSN
jgi:RimJ/RimL family protein N-acetyltransferase